MALAMIVDLVAVSGSVWTRMDVVAGGDHDRVGGGLDAGADDGVRDVLDLVLVGAASLGLELHAALELDAEVEPAHEQRDDGDEQDGAARSRYQRPAAADEVDRDVAPVELRRRVCPNLDIRPPLPRVAREASSAAACRGARGPARTTCGPGRRTSCAPAA